VPTTRRPPPKAFDPFPPAAPRPRGLPSLGRRPPAQPGRTMFEDEGAEKPNLRASGATFEDSPNKARGDDFAHIGVSDEVYVKPVSAPARSFDCFIVCAAQKLARHHTTACSADVEEEAFQGAVSPHGQVPGHLPVCAVRLLVQLSCVRRHLRERKVEPRRYPYARENPSYHTVYAHVA
jgi:hypothetical protein